MKKKKTYQRQCLIILKCLIALCLIIAMDLSFQVIQKYILNIKSFCKFDHWKYFR